MREQIQHITAWDAPARGAACALLASLSAMRGTTALTGRFTIDGVDPKTGSLVNPTIRRRPPLE